MKVLNLPNTLTVLRIVLIPVFITALYYEKYGLALYVFVFASATDMLDGMLARMREQKTELGRVMDPLADKFLLMASLVFFAYYGWIPPWLAIVVISRDLIVTTGTAALYFVTGALRVEPTVIGKAATALQFVLLCYVLLDINYGVPPGLKDVLVHLTAFFTAASGLHYVLKGLRFAGEKR